MRNSIYRSKKPAELKADMLLEYDKNFDEVWRCVPGSERRH